MNLTTLIIPLFVGFICFYGFFKKVDIYESFLEGAKDGLKIIYNILPTIVAMIFAVNMFLSSNFLNFFLNIIFKYLPEISFPLEIFPMALLRPVSGTASLAIMNDIFINYGPDSFIGRLASVIQGCTDTTIYVLALYFGSVKIKKTRYALKTGLLADLTGIIASFIIVKLMFG